VRAGIVWQSAQFRFDSPVRPYKGALSPVAIGTDRGLPKMIYAGTGAAPFVGRYFQKIGDRHYFTYGGRLETDNAFRGFDCITYVGSAYGISAASGNMTSSANLATAMGASPVNWTQPVPVPAPAPGQSPGSSPGQPPAPATPLAITGGIGTGTAIKAFFQDPARTGSYLIWTGGHIRVIVNKTVHEWSPPSDKNGYEAGPVATQVRNGTTYHLYSL